MSDAAEVDWLSAPETAPRVTRARANDPLHALLNGAQPDPDAAARAEARRLATIAANAPRRGEPKGSLAPEQTWLVADWAADTQPGGGGEVLANVRFMDGKAAARVAATFKRPFLGVAKTAVEAWRDLNAGFCLADGNAAAVAASEIQGLEWMRQMVEAGKR